VLLVGRGHADEHAHEAYEAGNDDRQRSLAVFVGQEATRRDREQCDEVRGCGHRLGLCRCEPHIFHDRWQGEAEGIEGSAVGKVGEAEDQIVRRLMINNGRAGKTEGSWKSSAAHSP